MLFDPFEEQFNLPPTLVKSRDRQRGQGEVVGQEHKPAIVLGVIIHDATQRVGVQPRRLRARQHDRLVAPQPRRLVDRATSTTAEVEAAFGARHKERRATREPMKTVKIDVSSIHHVERARFDRQTIENGHVGRFPGRNPHETGDVAAQVQKRVQLHRPLVTAEPRPGEQAQTEVDRGAVEGIGGLLRMA